MMSSRAQLARTCQAAPKLAFHSSEKNYLTDKSNPATLILGFGGAKPHHMEKYAELYHGEGLGAVSYTGTQFWDDVPPPQEGQPFAPLFLHPQHRDRPLILHVLSMNGFRHMLQLYRWLDHQGDTTHRLRGIIFDSCPSTLTPSRLAYGKAVSEFSTVDERGRHYLPQALWTTAKYALLKRMNEEALNEQQMYHYVGRWVMLPRNQLYCYSKEDNIVKWREVEQFAERQQTKGNCVQTERFPESLHVQHIRSDPARYRQAIQTLLKKSL